MRGPKLQVPVEPHLQIVIGGFQSAAQIPERRTQVDLSVGILEPLPQCFPSIGTCIVIFESVAPEGYQQSARG